MLNAPTITFRSGSAPYNVISSLQYIQSALQGVALPVLGGENSNLVLFRIYNNWNMGGSVSSMDNVSLTVFDGADPSSHTATKSPVSQSWVRVYESGFGESKGTPAIYTRYIGTDTAIGRSGVDSYAPELGSDGTSNPRIRAGTDGNGVGFIEFYTYTELPEEELQVGFANYTMALSIVYDWVT